MVLRLALLSGFACGLAIAAEQSFPECTFDSASYQPSARNTASFNERHQADACWPATALCDARAL